MRLYLVQHGPFASKAEDPRGPLTEAGRRAVHKLAAHISQFSLAIDVIEHSDKLRAQQTAAILDLQLRPSLGSKQVEGLAPADPVKPVADRLRAEPKDIMLVGHLPHLNSLANTLLGLKAGAELLRFQEGGCLCLESDDKGKWAVCWMLTPDLLPEEEGRSPLSGTWQMDP
jgi:phosphohistidine phosphatase